MAVKARVARSFRLVHPRQGSDLLLLPCIGTASLSRSISDHLSSRRRATLLYFQVPHRYIFLHAVPRTLRRRTAELPSSAWSVRAPTPARSRPTTATRREPLGDEDRTASLRRRYAATGIVLARSGNQSPVESAGPSCAGSSGGGGGPIASASQRSVCVG